MHVAGVEVAIPIERDGHLRMNANAVDQVARRLLFVLLKLERACDEECLDFAVEFAEQSMRTREL